MLEQYKKLISILGESRVLMNEPLCKYSSFRLGGPADVFYKAGTQDELLKAVKAAKELHIPLFVISGGTNLLIHESGFRGLVIKNETNGIRLVGVRGGRNESATKVHTVYLQADSGVSVNRLVRSTLDQGLCGLEAFLGQPGSIGGAVWINAHNLKMGKYFGDAVFGAKILTPTGEIKEVARSYFKFDYDQSIIQKTHDIILSVLFKLEAGEKKTLWKTAQEALEYRRITQPVSGFSSGCIFRNISKSDAIKIATPNYTQSAGYLIDRVGLKGFKSGDAYISSDHANFIINKGHAKAQDVLTLINFAKKKVKQKYNIQLKEEIVVVGTA